MADDLPPGFRVVQPAGGDDLPPGFRVVEQKPSVGYDMAASFASGVPEGAAETLMLPISMQRIGTAAGDKMAQGADYLMRAIFGMDERTPEMDAKIAEARAGSWGTKLDNLVGSGQDYVRGLMNDYLYEPQTTPGKFANTTAQFLAPGAFPSKAARAAPTAARMAGEYATDLVGNVVLPGLLSEGAGQLTEGSDYEGVARAVGALAGNVSVAAGRAYNAPEAVIRRATSEMSDADWARAQALQNNSTGVRLTGPEAIAQARDGASALPNIQRVVEGSIEGRARTGPFFAQRPGQVDNAVNDVLDAIAPQSTQPSTLGARAANVAEDAITASPAGQALSDAVFSAGPRTTPLQAGEVIQPELGRVYAGREGVRNALSDQAYSTARAAEPRIAVDDLSVDKTVRAPAYTKLEPGSNEITGVAEMQARAVPAQIETPSMTSRTGPDVIQVDARPVVKAVDQLAVNARAETRAALQKVRGMLFTKGGVDTSVTGLDSARLQIGDMINEAKRNGQMQSANLLGQVQTKLDEALSAVPEYARAKDTFKAASEPLVPFGSPGMSKAIEKDAYGKNYTTPPEAVPDALMSPSELRNFNQVATPDALNAMKNRVATTILDSATDASGRVSTDALAQAMRSNEDILAQYPDVAAKLAQVRDAATGLDATRAGPLGRVASANNTQGAGDALLPQNPLTGSGQETADAVAALVAKDPTLIPQLVRQNLADRYSRAATETMEGGREFSGAKFHKSAAGNPQRQEVLDAVLNSLPGNSASPQMNELLDVLQATGRRKPIGSATEFNRSINVELGDASPVSRLFGLARSLGASFVTNAGDATRRAALRNNLDTLAEMFIDPQSVDILRAAVNRGAPVVLPEALARTGAQTAPLFDRERGPR
jgi:hypothetical protein